MALIFFSPELLSAQPDEFEAGWMSRMTEILLLKSSGEKTFWGLSLRVNLFK